MFDIAWSELFVIGAVALVVIGPKDLPKAMLALGRATRHARFMAQQLRQQFDQLSYEAEVTARAAAAKPQQPEPVSPPPSADKPHE